jgi:hypothetical protein
MSTETNTNEPKMCGIHRHAKAKYHFEIFACEEHGQLLKPKYEELLRQVEKEFIDSTTTTTTPPVVVEEPTTTTTSGSVDKYGIKKVYPDATDKPLHQFIDMNNIKSGRVDNYPSIFRKSDESVPGGFKAFEIGSGRVALLSENNNPFGSVEHTFYFKFMKGNTDSERLFQPYIGGLSHHTESTMCCEGNAMKVGIHGDGKINFRKELCHDAYCGDRKGSTNNSPLKNMKNGAVVGRWYGMKQIELHLPDRNRMEVYVDEGADDGNGGLRIEGNESRWRMIAVNEDKVLGMKNGRPVGDWSADKFDTTCTNCNSDSRGGKAMVNGLVRIEPYAITHQNSGLHDVKDIQNANAVILRIDGDKLARVAYWSARKIIAPS